MTMRTACAAAWVLGLLLTPAQLLAQLAAPAPVRVAAVDEIFAAWNTATPGCAVGVAEGDTIALRRAYGMADLEHGLANTPETIFEAGSVSKQFTAAVVLRLARAGTLSLDDDVRRHVPELPTYDAPITIRHLLTHTSGLRDWGSLAAIAGMPRGTRTYTHAHVVDILRRQRSLNFTPGTRWSYSNSGYNLAAVIVARASGATFADYSRAQVFAPLGLTHTSWRDDYARIVPNRAVAYARGDDGTYRQDMPFEHVHGNGGLLTTVGDLLAWQRALATGPFAGSALADEQQAVARLADGRALHYGLGVFRGSYKGVAEIFHSGSTAGYRAFLTYYPDARLGVAVLCNAADANATALARRVSDLFLGERADASAPAPATLPEAQGPLVALSLPPRDETWRPSRVDLAAYAGTYDSDEVETRLVVEVEGDALVVSRRPDARITLRPDARDSFDAPGLGRVTFHRRGDRIVELGVTEDRVWDLRFTRRPDAR